MGMNDKRGSYSFRFQNLEIWKKAIEIGMDLFSIADDLDEKRLHRFAEQIRAPALFQRENLFNTSIWEKITFENAICDFVSSEGFDPEQVKSILV